MRDRAGSDAIALARHALPCALLGVMGFEIAHLISGGRELGSWAHLSMLAVVLTALPRCGVREAYLLTLCAVLAGLLWWLHDEPVGAALRALDQAVFLMAFILLISLVQEAAQSSGSVARLGMFLARQPGGRRFVALYGGTNIMAVVFNLGTLSLLAPLVRRAAEEAPDDPLTPVRERRQLSALLRGFAWSVIWSPTAVAPLALLGLIDGIDRPRWIAMGLVLALIIMGVGWAEDRLRWRGQNAAALGLPPPPVVDFPREAALRFAAVCVVLGLTVGVLIGVTGLGVLPSLMAASPMLLLGWLAVQSLARETTMAGFVGGRLAEIVSSGLPQSAPAAVTLACSGFVGIAGAALIPAQALSDAIGLETMSPWLFLLGTTLAVTLLSQFALSPIMMAVFFGAVLGALPVLPAEPTLTALAVAAGWSVSTTISPFASGVIFLARVTGHSGARLTYHWNGVFTGLSVLVLAAAYWVLLML